MDLKANIVIDGGGYKSNSMNSSKGIYSTANNKTTATVSVTVTTNVLCSTSVTTQTAAVADSLERKRSKSDVTYCPRTKDNDEKLSTPKLSERKIITLGGKK